MMRGGGDDGHGKQAYREDDIRLDESLPEGKSDGGRMTSG